MFSTREQKKSDSKISLLPFLILSPSFQSSLPIAFSIDKSTAVSLSLFLVEHVVSMLLVPLVVLSFSCTCSRSSHSLILSFSLFLSFLLYFTFDLFFSLSSSLFLLHVHTYTHERTCKHTFAHTYTRSLHFVSLQVYVNILVIIFTVMLNEHILYFDNVVLIYHPVPRVLCFPAFLHQGRISPSI